jgi:hypothetical protein
MLPRELGVPATLPISRSLRLLSAPGHSMLKLQFFTAEADSCRPY